MPEGMRWVGLDVHAHETACAVLDGTTGEVESRKFQGRPQQLLAWLEGLERPFRAVYEAGPTGLRRTSYRAASTGRSRASAFATVSSVGLERSPDG
jgi:hypothetical protein